MTTNFSLAIVSCYFLVIISLSCAVGNDHKLPLVINTWPFTVATRAAWKVINSTSGTPLDAVEQGCTACEVAQCDGTVGYGGSPDESGETTLDAMIMDGTSHDVGSVGCLKRIKSAISVARKVMELTNHTLLVGDEATRFAISTGFKQENLHTNKSVGIYKSWLENNCQPNFWKGVTPNPRSSCGPYRPADTCQSLDCKQDTNHDVSSDNHDTIGMIVVDKNTIAGGTSTNGANHKISGRVGDSPIAGAGLYVDKDIGGSAATGDGDVMMRFLPSYQVVESMRLGMSPKKATTEAIMRIKKYYPHFNGALIAVNMAGEVGIYIHCNSFKNHCNVN
ncbi:uncharacterized protein TRIADDRAFT_24893 [Trichoplax adhaerens]|uniref:N(4)-(beta-N-acetylglucosaminyl)-L-asparaginase n=1 Tax=Trichoplax adhaerens TaxID=10228 RepID=B3RYR9_TRIAD|nr:hypothetical protein TRIADDRAFT_24893 [Trichoplax adhaerens]EDV24643.1 hypothetical protein TRIADDRAFT_24893 [Trichoplax adhaerens]|eukprot:XP_002112533.1 hypothetical protein TRIADDRAFT_24893 [Trichoplax adhaerens]